MIQSYTPCYIGTACLDRNRWGSRQPSFRVSEWLPRFRADGFDGIELWEFHFLRADEEEQQRLVTAAAPLAVYNAYVGFGDGEAEARATAAAAITRLQASAVKFNVGADPAQRDTYRRNLLAWAEQLPATCRLLCECHPGTMLEQLEAAVAFLAALDPERFGVIVHVAGDPAGVASWFSAFEGRVRHLHLQLRSPETDPSVPANRAKLDACFEVVKAHGFAGSAAVEFTRGIGKHETIEALYTNARADLACLREALAGGPGGRIKC